MSMVEHSEIEGILVSAILENPQFLDMLAMRIVKRIAAGPSEGNEVVTQVSDQYFTRHQLERLKKAFVFLMNQDSEFQMVMRKVLRRHTDMPIKEPLTRYQLIRRIQEFGAIGFNYKGKMCGFFASEVYAALGEYSHRQVIQMLKDTGLWLRDGTRKHPKTGKNNRTIFLDI